ncbi:hypothetical protein J2778_006241 [Paraburkholderia graminis]|uniref:hypothetical protein n=1 Tax=Paraburkholderia graminis TaxID=60548 RepID=UPI0028658EB2|nr:hypothetical protein [Paraburkholderia graminis]MDR6478734.1 hypothetical protein [Paraburkholderia graminis]
MNGWDAVFFPPSAAFAADSAKRLLANNLIGRVTLHHAKDVIARIYGFTDWAALYENILTDHVSVAVWDDELSEGTLFERMCIQIAALMSEPSMTEARARFVLDQAKPTDRIWCSPKGDLDDFCRRLDGWNTFVSQWSRADFEMRPRPRRCRAERRS